MGKQGWILKGVVCGVLCLGVTFMMTACEEDNDTTGPSDENTNTITGIVYLPDSLAGYVVRLGTLEGWMDFNTGFDDTTLLDFSMFYDGDGSIQPSHILTLDAGSAERSYSYDLPTDDYENVDWVIAWVDKNSDSAVETVGDGSSGFIITEQMRVPLKEYEGSTYVIDSWGYIASTDDVEFLLFINSENLGLSIVGRSGFDFHFD